MFGYGGDEWSTTTITTKSRRVYFFAVAVVIVGYAAALPVVDKGVFVITGVKTCRDGYGYCILGTDCTVDKEFIADDLDGHCDGLKKAFTPRAFFVCCQSLENSTLALTSTTTSTTTTSTTPSPPSLEEDEENESNASSPGSGSEEDSGSKVSAESGEIGGNVTATTSTSTTVSPNVVEEVHTEISVSENFHVVVGEPVIGQGVPSDVVIQEVATTSTSPPTTTTTTTTTEASTTTTSTTTTTTEAPPVTKAAQEVNDEQCGYKATFYSGASAASVLTVPGTGLRIDGSRLAAQQTSLVCWTGAIVRSPSSLTLQDPGSFICTGALISDDFLLTTATCVSRLFAQDLSLFKVALGSRHLVHPMNGPTPDATYKDIVQLIVHEDYNIQGLFKRVNDIALVRLAPSSNIRSDETAKLSSPYCTVCLPDGEEDHAGEDCIVTGFSHPTGSAATSIDELAGVESGHGHGGNTVPSAHDTDGILHEADQRIEYPTNCEIQLTNFTVAQNTLLRNDLNIEQSKLVCASGKFNAEACFSPRDAGSPLACSTASSPDQYKLVGVFSSGFHCGTTASPVLYTDVSKFVSWVRTNMQVTKEMRRSDVVVGLRKSPIRG